MNRTPLFVRIVRALFRRYFAFRHTVRREGFEKLPVSGPFLVLSNHVHLLDPFFISAYSPLHIRWIAGSYLFRMKIVGAILSHLVTAISKYQGRSDMHMMRSLTQAFKKGDVVGLFPEATRTWDGEPIEFDQALVKMIRIFKVPVVIMNIEGGYFLHPRWAYHARKGPVTISVHSVISPDALQAMSLEELYGTISTGVGFSHRRMQEYKPVPYRGKNRAEGCEQILYLEPNPSRPVALSVKGDRIQSLQSDWVATLNAYDRLEPLQGTCPFPDLAAWRTWERNELLKLYRENNFPLFPPDRGLRLELFIDNSRKFHYTGSFSIQLLREGFLVTAPQSAELVLSAGFSADGQTGNSCLFLFSGISSLIVNAKSTMEFMYQGELWRIRLQKGQPVLKYSDLFADVSSLSEGVHHG